mgnify:FL=1
MNLPEKDFYLLTGEQSKINQLISKFGQKENEPESHTNVVFVGNLSTGNWIKSISIRSSKEIVDSISAVLLP